MRLSTDTLCRLYEYTWFLGKVGQTVAQKSSVLLVIHHAQATNVSALSIEEKQSLEALIQDLGIGKDYLLYFTAEPKLPKSSLDRTEQGFILLSQVTQWEIATRQVSMQDEKIKQGKKLFALLISNWSDLRSKTTNPPYFAAVRTALGVL